MPSMLSGNSSSIPLSPLRRTILRYTPFTREPCMPKNRCCPRNNARASDDNIKPTTPTITVTFSVKTHTNAKTTLSTSPKELKHIGIAACACHRHWLLHRVVWKPFWWFLLCLDVGLVMAAFAVIMTASFLVHEIAHKVMAQKKGMWAEFRLNNMGCSLNACFSIFALQNDCARRNDDWRIGTQRRRHSKNFHRRTHYQHDFLKRTSWM